MEEEIIKTVVKTHWYSNLPKWLKVILLILSLVTVVYWVGRLIAIILEAVRQLGDLAFKGLSIAFNKVGSFLFDEKKFYTYISCVVIAVIACVLVCEFVFDLGVFEKVANWALEIWERFKETMTDLIGGVKQ